MLVILYFTMFALIAGAAFAMMWANINALWAQNTAPKPRHPEAPEPGDEVMGVDLSRQYLESLLQSDDDDDDSGSSPIVLNR